MKSVVLLALCCAASAFASEPEVLAATTWQATAGAPVYAVQKLKAGGAVYLEVADPFGKPVWRSPDLGSEDHLLSMRGTPSALAVEDVTGDGVPELVTAAFYGPEASGLYVFAGSPQAGFRAVPVLDARTRARAEHFVSDRPLSEGRDLRCLPGGRVRVIGRSFSADGTPPQVMAWSYTFRDGAYWLADVDQP